MATTWGSYVSASGVSLRAGLDLSYSPSSLTATTTSVTVSWKLLLQLSSGFANGNDDWAVSGAVATSGVKSWSLTGSGAVTTIASGTKTVTLGSSTQAFTMSGSVSNLAGSTNRALVTATLTVPKKLGEVPAVPASITSTRVSDTRIDLSCEAAAGAQKYEWSRYQGGASEWVPLATTTAPAYVDASTRASRHYRYRVRAVNAAGPSAWRSASGSSPAYSAWEDTTPATPAAPTVEKTAAADIVVGWGGGDPLPPLDGWRVEHSADGGTTWDPIGPARIKFPTVGWTHVNPDPATSHTYRTVALTLYGDAPSSKPSPKSATLSVATPPLKSTDIGPDVADAREDVVLTFRHRPGADGAKQTAVEYAWCPWTAGTPSTGWTYGGKIVTAEGQVTVPAGTWTNTNQPESGVEVRVRTWGAHSSPSPWSDSEFIVLTDRPVVSILSPDPVVRGPELFAAWSYSDSGYQGTKSTAWRAVLTAADGTVLETRSGTTQKAVRFATVLADQTTYTLTVTARDREMLWSQVEELTIRTDFLLPPAPDVAAIFYPDDGYTAATVTIPNRPPQPDQQLAALDHIRLDRSTTDGWVTVIDNIAPGDSVTDMLPPLGRAVSYRAVAVSTIGSTAYGYTTVDTSSRWCFVNHGPGFAAVARIWGNLSNGRDFSRTKTQRRYAGRRYPVERAGQSRDQTYKLSGVLFAPWLRRPDLTSSYEDFMAAADAPAPVCVRDPEGVRLFVSTGSVSLSDYPSVHPKLSLDLTVIDYDEDVHG